MWFFTNAFTVFTKLLLTHWGQIWISWRPMCSKLRVELRCCRLLIRHSSSNASSVGSRSKTGRYRSGCGWRQETRFGTHNVQIHCPCGGYCSIVREDYRIGAAQCITSAEYATIDLVWRLYPQTFFEQYRYGNLANWSNNVFHSVMVHFWRNIPNHRWTAVHQC